MLHPTIWTHKILLNFIATLVVDWPWLDTECAPIRPGLNFTPDFSLSPFSQQWEEQEMGQFITSCLCHPFLIKSRNPCNLLLWRGVPSLRMQSCKHGLLQPGSHTSSPVLPVVLLQCGLPTKPEPPLASALSGVGPLGAAGNLCSIHGLQGL